MERQKAKVAIKTSIYMDESVWKQYRIAAAAHGTTVGRYVESVLRERLQTSGAADHPPPSTVDIADLDRERQKYARQFVAALRGPNYHKLRLALPGLLHFATSAGKEE